MANFSIRGFGWKLAPVKPSNVDLAPFGRRKGPARACRSDSSRPDHRESASRSFPWQHDSPDCWPIGVQSGGGLVRDANFLFADLDGKRHVHFGFVLRGFRHSKSRPPHPSELPNVVFPEREILELVDPSRLVVAVIGPRWKWWTITVALASCFRMGP